VSSQAHLQLRLSGWLGLLLLLLALSWPVAAQTLSGPGGGGSSAAPVASVTGASGISCTPTTGAVICSFTGGGAGTGNVTGPDSSTVNDIAVFNSTNGEIINDLGPTVGLAMVTPSGGFYISGYYLRLPTIDTSTGNEVIFGQPVSYSPGAHRWVGCNGCQINPGSAGTTAFVGTDGNNTPILGDATHGVHMTVIGPSVDCEADEAVCIGHGAQAVGTAPSSVVIGQAHNTSSSGDVLIQTSDSGGTSINVGIWGSGFGTGSGFGLQINNRTCSSQTAGFTIEVGYAACATEQGHIVIGGSLASAFYAGTESRVIPIFAQGIFNIGLAPDETDYGTCARTASSWVGGVTVGTFVASGICAAGGTYEFLLNTSINPTTRLACDGLVDIDNTAVVLREDSDSSGRVIKFEVVTGSPSVANSDHVQVSCANAY